MTRDANFPCYHLPDGVGAADRFQRPLHSRFRQQLTPGVQRPGLLDLQYLLNVL